MYDKKLKSPYRDLIAGIDTPIPLINGQLKQAINFDNGATTPPFISVLQEINKFAPWYSSIHRGTGYKSQISSLFYETSRLDVLNFVGGDAEKDTVIYVKNTTEAINKLANRLYATTSKNVILSSFMEHHSNDLPWRNEFDVHYIETEPCGKLSMTDFENKLKAYHEKLLLVTITGASNVTGHKNPIHKISALAHEYGAKVLVDGAQLVPHSPVNMRPEDSKASIDFLTFSAHKMYAPFGIGVLVGPRSIFEKGTPDHTGGGTVKFVTHDHILWDDPPHKDEAGTPNIMGVVALVAAINTLKGIGMAKAETYETSLVRYGLSQLETMSDINLYCTKSQEHRIATIPFNIKDMHHTTVAQALSYEAGIAVRSGCFCAQPYVKELLQISDEAMAYYIENPNEPRPGMVRISLGLYNDYEEMNQLILFLKKLIHNKAYYKEKYPPTH